MIIKELKDKIEAPKPMIDKKRKNRIIENIKILYYRTRLKKHVRRNY